MLKKTRLTSLFIVVLVTVCLVLFLVWQAPPDKLDNPVTDVPPPLFKAVRQPDHIEKPTSKAVLRSRYVVVTPEKIDSIVVSTFIVAKQLPGKLALPLFDDALVTLTILEKDVIKLPDRPTLIIFSGGVVGEKYAIATLTVKEGSLFAKIDIPGQNYRILPVEPPLHRIDQMVPAAASPHLILE